MIEEAFENKRAKKKKISTKTVFAKEEDVVPEEFHKLSIIMLEGMDKQQKATLKERYAQVEGIRQQRIENVMRIPGLCHSDDAFSSARSNKSSLLVRSCTSVVNPFLFVL